MPTLSSTRKTSRGAFALLLMAIISGAIALWSGQQGARIQGPSTLGSLPDGSVWLVVDQAMWLLSPSGRQLTTVPIEKVGLTAPPAVLAYRHNTQELYAIARGSATVYVLHPRTAQVQRLIQLQWPEAFKAQLGGAVWLAVADDGRLAVATGAGHAVLLFDPEGRYLTRTRAGLYRYTNDLWWDGNTLWTTDTNGMALVQLNGDTLNETGRLTLHNDNPWRYTALAKPHPHAGISALAPRATLSRLDGHMRLGRVVQVWADGREEELKLGPDAEPLDLWAGDTLLVVDGHDWRLRRFDTLNQGLSDFGDASVRDALATLKRSKKNHQLVNHVGVTLAVFLLTAGIVWAWHSRRRHAAPLRAQALQQTRFLGTPLMTRGQFWRGALVVLWPLASLLLALVVTRLLISPQVATALGLSKAALTWLLVVLVLGNCALIVVLQWWWRRCARQPGLEPIVNAMPVRWLLQSTNWIQHVRPEEQVRETWLLQHWRGRRWMVLTNQRLMSFRMSGLGRRQLDISWDRKQIRKVQLLDWSALSWSERLTMSAMTAGIMRIQFQDGQILQGGLHSLCTAQRVQAQLNLRNHLMRSAPQLPAP